MAINRLYLDEGLTSGQDRNPSVSTSGAVIASRRSWTRPICRIRASRERHLYIVGKSGSGKSTVLLNLAMHHIVAGEGVAVIDPHGDLAEAIIDAIPKERMHEGLLFQCCRHGISGRFNPIAGVPRQRHALAAAGIVAAFKHLWGESWGPRLEHFLFHGVAALLESPRPTLIDLARIYTDEDFRSRIVPRISDPVIARFWTQEFASYDQRFQAEAASPFSTRSASSLPHRHCAISWGKWRRNSTLHTRWTIAASSLRTSRKDR